MFSIMCTIICAFAAGLWFGLLMMDIVKGDSWYLSAGITAVNLLLSISNACNLEEKRP